MASTPEGAQLTQAQQQAQTQLRNQFLIEFIALWPLLDSRRLDETGPGWVAAATRLISAYRQRSAEIATRYYAAFAAAEAPHTTAHPLTPAPPAGPLTGRPPRHVGDTHPVKHPPAAKRPGPHVIPHPRESRVRFDIDPRAFDLGDRRHTVVDIATPKLDEKRLDRAVKVSLTVTGPVGQKSKVGRGKPLQVARDESLAQASGAAIRHVLDGGNRSLLTLIGRDDLLLGYIRVTAPDPCYFCAMLASRGPVYRTPKRAGPNQRGTRNANAGVPFIGDGQWKVHDHCRCTVEPVYTSSTGWPGQAKEFQKLWNDTIRKRYSGEEAIRQWRHVYEEHRREQRRLTA